MAVGVETLVITLSPEPQTLNPKPRSYIQDVGLSQNWGYLFGGFPE